IHFFVLLIMEPVSYELENVRRIMGVLGNRAGVICDRGKAGCDVGHDDLLWMVYCRDLGVNLKQWDYTGYFFEDPPVNSSESRRVIAEQVNLCRSIHA
ncbi:MAG: hypothetical protein ABIH92_00140, partial [Nanoarchaeota archaeon]